MIAIGDRTWEEACAEQVQRWVEGDAQHINAEGGGQCCPDFSCCKPDLTQPLEVRQAFAAAPESDRMRFLGTFLGAAVAKAQERGEVDPKHRIHVVTDAGPVVPS